MIKTGVVLSTTGLISSLPEQVYAGDNSYYYNRAYDKAVIGDCYGAISDFTKAIGVNPLKDEAYYNLVIAKWKIGDKKGAWNDWRKASSLGNEIAAKLAREHC